MSTQTAVMAQELGEVETEAQEAAYAAWMREMVKESDNDPRPTVPHDVVMAELRELVAEMKAHKAQGTLA